ncbi:monofunctional biosynthetic peptidoglycan transglycosylase [Algibacter amylolyticus]|uniref:Biosynthetic peptidoglycan transglycosylase n=1 Tax=Algibacter amylolyticus TaxID=1608400 RepID=A0A5M7BP35_9FLAO|nr:monofunctional biosynthetic peptidoglycan transglycosylase [Algibacter amylolyticus]KAA5828205.1 monofunctional biosynthetic peptidoglycan transglycosylase [Algibacter amylolyticus]TSJ82450.1 monofunctional biosynthetic peptidoglycan transglycosylase [Algibacter amylolyticus]
MLKRFFRFVLKTIFWLVVLSVVTVFLYKKAPVPATPLMVNRSIEQYQNGQDIVWKHDWVAMENISKNALLAVVCSEDQLFLNHNGFDLKAIEKAYENNKKGNAIKGGSTISQQTAKNVFLWPQRSWLRKGLETYFTFLIEKIWTKQRILEVYLNSIEMGNGIYGIEAASQYWFKKPASQLSKQEAAAIAAILPNPRKYIAHPATTYINSRKNWIVKQMVYFGTLDFKTNE